MLGTLSFVSGRPCFVFSLPPPPPPLFSSCFSYLSGVIVDTVFATWQPPAFQVTRSHEPRRDRLRAMGRRSKRARDTAPAVEHDVSSPMGFPGSHMDDRVGKRLVLQAMVSGVDSLAALPKSEGVGEASLGENYSLGWMANIAGGEARAEDTRIESRLINMFVSPRHTGEYEEEDNGVFFGKQTTPELDEHARTEREEEGEPNAKSEEEISVGSDGSSSESLDKEVPRKRGRGGALEGILG